MTVLITECSHTQLIIVVVSSTGEAADQEYDYVVCATKLELHSLVRPIYTFYNRT